MDETRITWLNGKINCEIYCDRSGGGPCPSICGKRGYCCKRPESTDEEIGSCPDIAKWSVLPVFDSKWRCVAPPGGFVDNSIDEESEFNGACVMDNEYSLLQHQFPSTDFRFRSNEMTPHVCFLECLNQGPLIRFYGIKNGTDCYCGDKLSFHYDFNGIEISQSSCNIPCPGDLSKRCGGSKALNLYSIIGFCISAKSSKKSRHCGRNKKAAYGSEIDIFKNGDKIGTIHAKFRKFVRCWPLDEIDMKYDNIQLKSTGDDNVCIAELNINNQKIMTGQNKDQQGFWLQKNKSECDDSGQMVTSEITIRDGQVISSACHDCSVSPDETKQCRPKLNCNATWSKFHSAKVEEKNKQKIRKAEINDPNADFYDPFLNGLISEKCSKESVMDVRLRTNKKDIASSEIAFEQNYQSIICTDGENHSCPDFEVRFCCERKDEEVKWISSPREYDDFEDGVNVLDKGEFEVSIKDQHGNNIDIDQSRDNLFDGNEDTFLELENEETLSLSLKTQIKLLDMTIRIKKKSLDSNPSNSFFKASEISKTKAESSINITFFEKRIGSTDFDEL